MPDPNAMLDELRQALERAKTDMAEDTDHPLFCVVPNGHVLRIVSAFEALDGWLLDGGYFPDTWRRGRAVD